MRRLLLILAPITLALGIGARFMARSAPAPTPTPGVAATAVQDTHTPLLGGDGKPRWRPLWTRPVPGLDTLSLAADGSTVAWRDARGVVRRIDGLTGTTLWQTPPQFEGARLLSAPGGRVIAWNPLRTGPHHMTILDGAAGGGREVAVGEILWSVALSSDGTSLVAGTGQKGLVRIALGPNGASRTLPTRLPGIPEALAARGGRLIASMWLPSGLIAVEPRTGKPFWRYVASDPARRYRVLLSADGSTLVTLSARGLRGTEALQLAVWSAPEGTLLFQTDIDGSEPQVRVSADGSRIALTCARTASYATGESREYKLTVFDRTGQRLVDGKGGQFFSPQLLALSASGARITVRDGDRAIYTLDARGRIVSRLALGDEDATATAVRQTVATDDGMYLLVCRNDDQATLFQAVAE
jgi:outer membrane protein assembly factor BamB